MKYKPDLINFLPAGQGKDTLVVLLVVVSVLVRAEIPMEVFSVRSLQREKGRMKSLGKDPFRSLSPSFISYKNRKIRALVKRRYNKVSYLQPKKCLRLL